MSDNEVVEFELDINNSTLKKLIEARFARTNLPASVVKSYLDSEELNVTPELEKDMALTEKIIYIAGKILFSEIVHSAAIHLMKQREENENTVLQESTATT